MSSVSIRKRDAIVFTLATVLSFVATVYFDFNVFDNMFDWMF